MNRPRSAISRAATGVPRASGDEPKNRVAEKELVPCSPRQRG